jgi:hypothetical protein
MTPGQEVQELVTLRCPYALTPFIPILQQILSDFGELGNLNGKDVLELGPGARVDLMRYLLDKAELRSIAGAGHSMHRPWSRQRRFIREHVMNVRLLDYFKAPLVPRYDLIYSRFVFEQHSIDPWILLTSRAYWRQFKKKDFHDFDETYPASIPNLRAVFDRAWQVLRAQGLFVALIGKRKYAALDRDFLERYRPRVLNIRDIGRLSQIVTVGK